MADDVKTVGVQWQVDFKQLTNAEKAQQRYITNLKKMNQMHGAIVASSQQMDQAMQRQTQAVGLVGEGVYQATQAIQTQTQAIEQQTQTVTGALTAIEQTITANNNAAQATQTNTKAQRDQTTTVDRNTASWGKNIKQLALYAIGAASVFRIVMKLRREFMENIEILFKNTEEYQGLLKAQDDLKASVLAFLGTEESFRQFFDNIAQGIERFVDGLIKLKALIETVKFTAREVEPIGDQLIAEGVRPINYLEELIQKLNETGEGTRITVDAWDVYNEKLEEGRARVEEWSAAITKAREEGESGTDRLTEAQRRYQQLLEQLVRAEENRIRDLIDLYEDYERKLEDIIETTNRALADLALEGARRREDIETAYQRRLEDIERQQQENRARNEERYRLKLLRIEMRYRERLIRIQEDFDDAMYDAIAKRDATAALMAIRRKDREQARALRERNDAIALATAEYNMQINEQRRSLEAMREEARIARQRALEDLAIDLARERQDIQTNHQRELEDLAIFLDRRRSDIEQDYEWQVTRAQAHYVQDEQLYAAHLRNRLTELQNYYRQVVAMYNTYAGMIASPNLPIGGGGITRPGLAEGGIAVFDRPTTINVAEKGPEIVIAQPVSAPSNVTISGGIQHQISGSVSAAMAGFEGRLGAIISEQVVRVMGEMLQ